MRKDAVGATGGGWTPWGLSLLGAKIRGRMTVEGREPYGSLNKSVRERGRGVGDLPIAQSSVADDSKSSEGSLNANGILSAHQRWWWWAQAGALGP